MFKCYGKVGETIHQRLCVQVPAMNLLLSLLLLNWSAGPLLTTPELN